MFPLQIKGFVAEFFNLLYTGDWIPQAYHMWFAQEKDKNGCENECLIVG